jgi:hypothetical protein
VGFLEDADGVVEGLGGLELGLGGCWGGVHASISHRCR